MRHLNCPNKSAREQKFLKLNEEQIKNFSLVLLYGRVWYFWKFRGGGVGEYQSFDTRLHDVFLDPMVKVMYLLKKLGKIGIHYSATV